jgi:hypothetical protein
MPSWSSETLPPSPHRAVVTGRGDGAGGMLWAATCWCGWSGSESSDPEAAALDEPLHGSSEPAATTVGREGS